MYLTAASISVGDASLAAVLGYGVVFLGLILLMIVVTVLGKAMSKKAKKAAPAPVAEAAPAAAAAAPGTAGEVKLFDVPDRTAAMIMAIVAEQTGRPLNELRFKSIQEVKEV